MTGSGEGWRRLSEEDVARAAHFVFGRVDRLREAVAQLPEPGVRSPLVGDDRVTDPHKVSHAAAQSLQAAAEHLDALRALVTVAQVLHPSAPFTLARAAIETGAGAVWVLAPTTRAERAHRALRRAARDAIDGDTAVTEQGMSMSRPLDVRRAEIDRLAAAVTGRAGQARPPTSTECVRAADGPEVSSFPVLFLWRLCSGFAHGRLWATLAYLEREVHPSSVPGDAQLRVSSSLDRTILASWAALDVAEHALTLYRTRGADPFPDR